MNSSFSRKQKLLLAFGLISIATGLIIQICILTEFSSTFSIIRSSLLIYAGALLLYYTLNHNRIVFPLFLSLSLILTGLFILMTDAAVFGHIFKELWPVIFIICGASFITATLIVKNRLSFSVVVPSLVFIFMGIFFLLFSLHLIKYSLKEFITAWWPLFFVLGGLILIAIFIYSHRTNEQNGKQ